ncbi:MAG: SUMF1/EgtB/PvdO family nonheme iron enzyme [Desulfobacterales bacterium]|nr:SUMF1/EgtB/PvdO family nonheme iron enzyme [Desulfobacterales bacterium]
MMKRFEIILTAFLISTACLWAAPSITCGKENHTNEDKKYYHTYALFIGIPDIVWVDDTKKESIGELRLADKIKKLKGYLDKYFDRYEVMTDKDEPTIARIRGKLTKIRKKNIDIFFLYYGGHGDYGHYVTVRDTNISSRDTFLDANDLLDWAGKVGKKRTVVIEACRMRIKGAHSTTEIDKGKLKLPPQSKEKNTFLFTPKQAVHKSVFLDTMKHLLENDTALYTPDTFYGEINSDDKWRSIPDLAKNVNIPNGFYVIDKRPYLTLKLDEDFPQYLRTEVSLPGKKLGELSASKELKNILLKNKRPGDSIMLFLTSSPAQGFEKKDIPPDYRLALETQRKSKEIVVKKGHFTDSISRSDIIDEPIQTNFLGMEFVRVKPGTFMMGSPETDIKRSTDEKQHKRLIIPEEFYLQTTEVTQGQWKRVMEKEPWAGKNYVREGSDYPAVHVSWKDCQEFIRRLNLQDKDLKYRLPDEAEWEYACKAGSKTSFSWGDTPDCSKANFGFGLFSNECIGKNPGEITKVGSYDPNSWGLYDMHGNVWEWCEDKYTGLGRYAGLRITRGGSWHNISSFCRSANRGRVPADIRLKDQGFRLVMEQ